LTSARRLRDDRRLRHWNGIRVGLLAAVALMCALPAVAGAQVVVTTPVDHDDGACSVADCTLREAITRDTAAEIQLPHDTYPLESELVVGRPVTIRGTQSDELATLTRANAGTPMRIVLIENAAQISKVRIAGGDTNAFGGGVHVSPGASLVLTDSEVTGNEAASGGGIWANGTLTLVRTTVAGNVARGDPEAPGGLGGGVGLGFDGAPATMVNTTLSGNTTTGQGGGLYTARSSFLRGVSIVDNVAPPRVAGIGQGGGLFQNFTGSEVTNALNVLVARNVNGGCGGTQNFPIDSDNGLIDEPLPNTTCNAVGDGNQIVPNAFLGPLEFNGGLTRTHMLLGNSPAIDRGAACEADDQRGVARPFGQACDIGAVERDALPDVNAFDDEFDGACTIDHCSLRERLANAPEGDVVTLGAGTYELVIGEPLDLDDDVTIVGAGARATTIDAGRTSRIGSVVDGAIVEVRGVTATRGETSIDSTGDRPGHGGAFYVDSDSRLEIVQSALTDNAALLTGGAVSNEGDLDVVESLVSRNRVGGDTPALGGGIYSVGANADVELVNSTLSRNVASPEAGDARGGGLYVAGAAIVENTTIAENSATEGAGLYDATGDSDIFGTLIAHNDGPECGDPQTVGDINDIDSLSDDTSCGFETHGVDPRLAPLANNGGPTDTHALYTGSPALDGADVEFCPEADQRLVTRPPGDCDIGAFEGSIAPPQDPGPPPPPPPGDDPPQPSQELPPPVAGRNVNAIPAGGTVTVKVKGSRRFVELREGDQIPVGSEIDTRKGRVTIEAAGGSVATFYDGLFRFDQGRGARPLTTLTLIERLACPKRGGKASAAAKRKKKRRLWGDGSGRFRTSGEYSSATVRGTRWLVEDRCDSTLTRVRQGRVSVRDFVKRKTVIVRAGKQYVAKRRR
jgi:CSLREA domain-containing protein